MKRLNKPIVTKETIRNMEDMSWFIHARIFDDLLIVAQKETNCFVLKTTEGLIVIDAIWPSQKAFDAIIDGIKDVGWNPETIKKLVLTHGHVDHTGCGKWFIEKYHVDTYLSETDRPALVRLMPLCVLSKSCRPSSCSKRFICFITAVEDMYKTSAAFEKLPRSAT